jgi:hypothetical protein
LDISEDTIYADFRRLTGNLQTVDNFSGGKHTNNTRFQVSSVAASQNGRNAYSIAERNLWRFDKTCKRCSEVYKITELKLNFIVLVGLFKANAFVTSYNDETAFYFLEKMPDKKHLNILLAHEITHLFQFSQLNDDDYIPTLADNIFTEGLACFASSCLCPGFSLSEYICMNFGWEHWISKCMAQFNYIKNEVMDNLESKNSEYFTKYFVGDNAVKNSIPTRIGYLIGYYVIEHLNKKYALDEIITWQQERIIKEVKDTVMDIL